MQERAVPPCYYCWKCLRQEGNFPTASLILTPQRAKRAANCFCSSLAPRLSFALWTPWIQTTAQSEERRGSPLTRHLLNAAEGAQVAGGGGLLQELRTEGDAIINKPRGEGQVASKLH